MCEERIKKTKQLQPQWKEQNSSKNWKKYIKKLIEFISANCHCGMFANDPGNWGSIPGWVIPKKKNSTFCHLVWHSVLKGMDKG